MVISLCNARCKAYDTSNGAKNTEFKAFEALWL